jgi:hypothetical protein
MAPVSLPEMPCPPLPICAKSFEPAPPERETLPVALTTMDPVAGPCPPIMA